MREYTEADREGLFMSIKNDYLFKNQSVPFSLHTVLKITRKVIARKNKQIKKPINKRELS